MSNPASDRAGRGSYVTAQRDRFEHPLFAKEKFCRGYAWDWLVANAIWKREGHQTEINGKIVTLRRGQLTYAVRFLADKWGWSKSAVDRFLTRLKTEAMIETDTGTGQLIITICNYEKYQEQRDGSGTATEPLTGTAAGQQRDSSGTKKNQDNQDNQDNDDSGPDENWILNEGSDWLISRGFTKTQIPRLINDWLKAYPAKQVRDAIGKAQIAAAANPPAYIATALKNGPRSNLQQFPHQREQSKLDREKAKKEAERREIEQLRAKRKAVMAMSKEDGNVD
jgi:hypothetical protein